MTMTPSSPFLQAEASVLAEQALAMQQEGDPAGAAALYFSALQALDEVPELHNNLALCLQNIGQPVQAETEFRRALALRPDYPEAHCNLGNLLQTLDRAAEATEHYRRALALDPAYANGWFNFGTFLLGRGRSEEDFAEAAAALEKAVSLRPDFAKAWRNLGMARYERGDEAGSLAACDEALRLDPEDAENRCNRALFLLTTGDFAQGWDEYEWRWRLADRPAPALPMPLWRGEDLAGKRLLLWTEQGAGTSIQFLRYAPLLAARGAEVSVACEASLQRLFATAGRAGVRQVVAREAAAHAKGDFDFYLPLVSAAHRFGTGLGTIPPPLSFDLPVKERLAPRTKPRIALVWAGNPINDARRAIPLRALAPLATALGEKVEWISLQRPPETEEIGSWPVPIEERGTALADFYDAALALREADFVVSVDTASAHLAASLGCPTAILLRYAADWRWLRDRADNPWYPSARLFRQHAPDHWEEAVSALAESLKERFAP